MYRLFRYIKLLLVLLFIFAFISISTIFYTLWRYSPELPSYESIVNYKPNLSSRIYSADGLLLKSFYTEERIFIPESRIPENIKLAFLSSEDKNFYRHYGVDVIAIVRALFTNILNTVLFLFLHKNNLLLKIFYHYVWRPEVVYFYILDPLLL